MSTPTLRVIDQAAEANLHTVFRKHTHSDILRQFSCHFWRVLVSYHWTFLQWEESGCQTLCGSL